MWLFFFSSRRRHTRCALVTGVQTCALPIYRQTIVALALAPDEQLTGAPVDIIEPDGDHLRCPQPKARHHQQHCMIAQTMLRIVADPCEQGFDLLGRQEARKSRVPALGYGRHRSEEHTSELQSQMRNSYAVFCLKKKKPDKK